MSNWRSIGDTTLGAFRAEFDRFDSPMWSEAAAIYNAAKPHSALCLGMMFVEQKYATNSIIPTALRNPLSQTRSLEEQKDGKGRWKTFGSWVEAVTYWRERLTSPTGPYKDTVTLEDLIHVYAPAYDNNNPAKYVAEVRQIIALYGATPNPTPEDPPVARPKILLTRGHGTTGDTGAFAANGLAEETYNRLIIKETARVLRAAGWDVTTWPANPDHEVVGTLDTEGWAARNWMIANPGDVVHIDFHLEKSSARGIFAIVANDAGLVTGAAGAQPSTDLWANNVGDRALGKAICEEIHELSGIPLRTAWVREPGLMSEDMTYVGQGVPGSFPPSRLAMFGYTAEFHQRAYRLIVEFANLDNDQAHYTSANFPKYCANGVLAALNQTFGVASEPVPEPEPEPVYALPQKLDLGPWDGNDRVLADGTVLHACKRTLTARTRTRRFQFADDDAPPIGKDLNRRDKAPIDYVFKAANGTGWAYTEWGTRLRLAHFTPYIRFQDFDIP